VTLRYALESPINICAPLRVLGQFVRIVVVHALSGIRDAVLLRSHIPTLLLQEDYILVDVHSLGLLDVEEELLCVASNLRP